MAVHPTLQMSEAEVMPTISMTSGAIQYGVPTTGSLMAVSRVSSIRVATPKSASLTIPCLVVRMLAPLMSRCTVRCAWR